MAVNAPARSLDNAPLLARLGEMRKAGNHPAQKAKGFQVGDPKQAAAVGESRKHDRGFGDTFREQAGVKGIEHTREVTVKETVRATLADGQVIDVAPAGDNNEIDEAHMRELANVVLAEEACAPPSASNASAASNLEGGYANYYCMPPV